VQKENIINKHFCSLAVFSPPNNVKDTYEYILSTLCLITGNSKICSLCYKYRLVETLISFSISVSRFSFRRCEMQNIIQRIALGLKPIIFLAFFFWPVSHMLFAHTLFDII
jgi:hypothetical protein